MDVSLFLPTIHEGRFIPLGALSSEHVLHLSVVAEQSGYDGIWIGEFLESQADVKEKFRDPPNYYAPFSTLGYLAKATTRLRLTTGVLVLPYHDPLVLAREFATLDVLTGGRMTLGGGLGGSVERYRATRKSAGQQNRSEMIEELVAAVRVLWSTRMSSFEGNYFEFHDVETFPKPVQQPLPVALAAAAEPALLRVGRIADGWIDTKFPPDIMRDSLKVLHRGATENGRDASALRIMRSFFCCIAETDESAETRRQDAVAGKPTGRPNGPEHEYLLVGSPASIVRQLSRYAGLGISEINVAFFHRDAADGAEQIRMFADLVLPHLRDGL